MRKFLILILSLFGLFDSIYLWWVYTSPSHPLVCLGTGCDVARASSYSHFFGLPMPFYGAVMYGALALLVVAESLGGRALNAPIRYATLAVSGAGFVASLGLSGVEAFVLHAWCAWCVASAIAVTLILLLAISGTIRPPLPLEAPSALTAARAQFVVFIIALAAGSAAFVHLSHSGEMAAPKPAPAAALEQRLVRADSHATGNLQSPVTVVEFGDFECPICGLAQKSVTQMLDQYGSRIRFVFRQFPLASVHPRAEKAAEASECAAVQGKFWEAEKLFYQKQADLSSGALDRYAGDLGLNTTQFGSCLASGAMAPRVQQDIADGKALGVVGTPTFFVGHQEIYGPPNYAQLSSMLDEQLTRAGTAGAPRALPSSQSPASTNSAAKAAPLSPPASSSAAANNSGLGSVNPVNPFGGGSANTLGGGSPLACSPDEAKLEQPTLIHTDEAKKLFDGDPKAVFADVRDTKEFAAGHIPGAINIPVEDITEKWSTLPKDKVIVFYEGGDRSGSPDDVCAFSRAAGRVALSHGFDRARVKVYQDGLKGWKEAGLPVDVEK
ncbi:MAG: thioredoxin domain-containing protein [Terriglobia bacterium]